MANRSNAQSVQKAVADRRSARRWLFTWNNYTDEIVADLSTISADRCDMLMFGFEKAPETGTPHLQGYVEFKDPLQMTTVKSKLDLINKSKSTVHVEKCKSTRQANVDYVTKPETKDPDHVNEDGSPVIVFVEHKISTGKESIDWSAVNSFLKENNNLSEFADKYPMLAMKHCFQVKEIAKAHKAQNALVDLKNEFLGTELRPWQQYLVNEVSGPVNDRQITWYYDQKGNSGKTWIKNYLVVTKDAHMISGSQRSIDVLHSWNGERIVVFDYTRSQETQINYTILEALKGGIVSSPKYDSCNKKYKPPHVVVMANFFPHVKDILSGNRWDIRYLRDGQVVCRKTTDDDFNIVNWRSLNPLKVEDVIECPDDCLISQSDEIQTGLGNTGVTLREPTPIVKEPEWILKHHHAANYDAERIPTGGFKVVDIGNNSYLFDEYKTQSEIDDEVNQI